MTVDCKTVLLGVFVSCIQRLTGVHEGFIGVPGQCTWTRNLTSFDQSDNFRLPVDHFAFDPGLACSLHVHACKRCRVLLDIRMDTEAPCNRSYGNQQSLFSRPRPHCSVSCRWVLIEEPHYPRVTRQYHSATLTYTSLSSQVVVHFCLPHALLETLRVNYTVTEKLLIISGSVKEDLNGSAITSPNFPFGYAINNEIFSYEIRSSDKAGYIRVTFDDWDLAPHSKLIFYTNQSRSKRLSVHYGSNFPPVLQSEGSTLFITFHAGQLVPSLHTNYRGFSASLRFVTDRSWPDRPTTECGGEYWTEAGGNVTFHASPWHHAFTFDCIWLIHRDKEFKMIYLRLTRFQFPDCHSSTCSLVIRNGITSKDKVLLEFDNSNHSNGSGNETLSSQTGFYVRFSGTISRRNFFSLVFVSGSAANAEECSRSWEFLCGESNLCIDRHLTCDHTEHCPYGEDEIQSHCDISYSVDVPTLRPDWSVCHNWEFLCSDGRQCVPKSCLCDRWLDCTDGSDEYLCTSPSAAPAEHRAPSTTSHPVIHCGQGLWRCHTMDKCIFDWQVCDGFPNCPDGSDESLCSQRGEARLGLKPPWNILLPLSLIILVLFFGCIVYVCIRYRNKSAGAHGHGRISFITRGYIHPPGADTQSTLTGTATGMERPDTPPSYHDRRHGVQFVNQGFIGDTANMQVDSAQSSPNRTLLSSTGPQVTTMADINSALGPPWGRQMLPVHSERAKDLVESGLHRHLQLHKHSGQNDHQPIQTSHTDRTEACPQEHEKPEPEERKANTNGNLCSKRSRPKPSRGYDPLAWEQERKEALQTDTGGEGNTFVAQPSGHEAASPLSSPVREHQPLLDVTALCSLESDQLLANQGELMGVMRGARADCVSEI